MNLVEVEKREVECNVDLCDDCASKADIKSASFHAVEKNHLNCLAHLDLAWLDDDTLTLMTYVAAAYGSLACLSHLRMYIDDFTAIHAARNDQCKCLEFIVEAGAHLSEDTLIACKSKGTKCFGFICSQDPALFNDWTDLFLND